MAMVVYSRLHGCAFVARFTMVGEWCLRSSRIVGTVDDRFRRGRRFRCIGDQLLLRPNGLFVGLAFGPGACLIFTDLGLRIQSAIAAPIATAAAALAATTAAGGRLAFAHCDRRGTLCLGRSRTRSRRDRESARMFRAEPAARFRPSARGADAGVGA